MLFRLLLLFTVLPLIELRLLVWIKDQTSWSMTFLLVLLTGCAGAALARWQGWRTVGRIQDELAHGRMPTDSLLDGLLILVAGALLVTPGVLTDAFGFLLLIPAGRGLIKRYVRLRLGRRLTIHLHGAANAGPRGHDVIIDVRVVDPDPRGPRTTDE
jgi:UPF0716 protein FxsA